LFLRRHGSEEWIGGTACAVAATIERPATVMTRPGHRCSETDGQSRPTPLRRTPTSDTALVVSPRVGQTTRAGRRAAVLADTGRPIRSHNPVDTTERDAGMLVRYPCPAPSHRWSSWPPLLAPRRPGRRRPPQAWPQLLGHDLDDRSGAAVLSGPAPLLEPAHDASSRLLAATAIGSPSSVRAPTAAGSAVRRAGRLDVPEPHREPIQVPPERLQPGT
jgi:hypothetical protein